MSIGTIAQNESVRVDVDEAKQWKALVSRVAKPHRSIRAASGVLISADGKTVGAYNMETVVHLPRFAYAEGVRVVGLDDWKRALASGVVAADDVYPDDDVPWEWIRGLGDVTSVVSDDGMSLTRALRFCGIAASMDESRPKLTGIQVDTTRSKYGCTNGRVVNVTATDSYRLHHANADEAQILGDSEMIIPGSVVKLLQGKHRMVGFIGESRVNTHRVAVLNVFSTKATESPYTIVSRLIEGTYPNWSQLKPERVDSSVTGDAAMMVDSMKRAKQIATRNNPIRICPIDGVLREAAGSTDWDLPWIEDASSDALPAIGINAGFAHDAVKGLADMGVGIIRFDTMSALRPMVFSADRAPDDAWVLVMPVRLPS